MPTGYTAAVQSGEVTEFPDFAMRCARACGALIMMRDEPSDAAIPDRFEPSTSYYDEAIVKAEARLAELKAMSTVDAEAASADVFVVATQAWWERMRARRESRSRYEAMLAKVEAWSPPTSDHAPMKEFMIEQLRGSIDHDAPPPTDRPWDQAPERMSAASWLADQIRAAEQSLSRNTEERAKEIARTEDRNQWLADLRRSLGGSP